MIIVKLNAPEFEYDIHSLVKAFYPKQDVSVTAEEKAYDKRAIWTMQLDYMEDSIDIKWWENEYDSADETSLIPKRSVELPGREFKVDFSNRTEAKNLLKQNLYQMLAAYTGK